MELKKLDERFYVTFQKQGHDKYGNPVYIINFFEKDKDYNYFHNVNFQSLHKVDKYGNIKKQSYNIDETIKYLHNKILQYHD